jgi:hypothetical protein
MTERPAHEWHGCDGDDCPVYKLFGDIQHPLFGASSMSYHDLAHFAAHTLDRFTALVRERDEDRQAIRALKEDHDVSGWTKGNPCTCEVCRENAAAIQRAQERP